MHKDAMVVTGTTAEGNPIWKKVGIFMKAKQSGREMLLLDRTFNPAGVAINPQNKNNVAIMAFDPQPEDQKPQQRKEPTARKEPDVWNLPDDDIPF